MDPPPKRARASGDAEEEDPRMRAVECLICYNRCRLLIVCAKGCQGVCVTCSKKIKDCPSCRGKLMPAFVPNLGLENAMQDVMRTCAFSGQGCNVMLPVANDSHEASCSRRPTPCPYAGCGKAVPFSEKDAHDASCAHRTATCAHDGCGKHIVGRKAIDAHRAGCDHRVRACPLGCVARVKQGDMVDHLRDFHLAVIVTGDGGGVASKAESTLEVTVKAGQPVEILSPPIVALYHTSSYLIVAPRPQPPNNGDVKIDVIDWHKGRNPHLASPPTRTVTLRLTIEAAYGVRLAYEVTLPETALWSHVFNARKVLASLKVPGASRAVETTLEVDLDVTWSPTFVVDK